jgi:hypothetical protein
MKKKRLDIEFSFEFQLHGITTPLKGYKLAWEINRLVGSNLIRMEDYPVQQKDGISLYLHFSHDTEINHFKLLKNKPQEEELLKNLLVPEHPRFDYFLLSWGEEAIPSNRLQEVLRNIPSVEWVAFIPLAALKSKENFIF